MPDDTAVAEDNIPEVDIEWVVAEHMAHENRDTAAGDRVPLRHFQDEVAKQPRDLVRRTVQRGQPQYLLVE